MHANYFFLGALSALGVPTASGSSRRMQPHRKINAAAASASPERGGELANLRHAQLLATDIAFCSRADVLASKQRKMCKYQHEILPPPSFLSHLP
jgi:hypothetical protein